MNLRVPGVNNSRPKITVVSHTNELGGASLSLCMFVEALLSFADVTVLVPAKKTIITDRLTSLPIQVVFMEQEPGVLHMYSGGKSCLSVNYWVQLWKSRKFIRFIDSYLKQKECDVFVVNSMTLSYLSPVLKQHGIKSVCLVRETKRYESNFANNFLAHRLSQFSKVVFISQFDCNNHALTETNSSIIYDCLASKAFNSDRSTSRRSFGLIDDDFVVCYVGGLSWLKGISTLVSSSRFLNSERIRYLIAGDFSRLSSWKSCLSISAMYYRRQLKRLRKLERAGRVVFAGSLPDISPVLAASDLLVFPARLPHQARPIFEAAAYKIPVVLPNYPHFYEFVTHGVNGLYFKPSCPMSLAATIAYASNLSSLKEMGEANRDRCGLNHSINRLNESIKELFQELV